MYNTDDLAQIESALLKLRSGEHVVSVAYSEHAIKYVEVDLQELISSKQCIIQPLKKEWLDNFKSLKHIFKRSKSKAYA